MTNKSLAFVFPGQGSQSLGMLADLTEQFPVVKETFAQASSVLGYDLWQLTQQGPESVLNQTERTQPALLAAGVAMWRIWAAKKGPTPVVMAGHSLGEYTALVCADALDYLQAVKLVAERGRYMQEAVQAGQGAMAALVGLSDDIVRELCAKAAQGQVISPANFNSIGQTVVAGETAAIERVVELAKQSKAKMAKLIPVSVPSHCALMKPAAERLAARLVDVVINVPKIPVINNVDVNICQRADDIRSALVRQLYSPVRWVETVQRMLKEGIQTAIECGPGKVISGLNKRIDPAITTYPVNSVESLMQTLTVLQTQAVNP